MKTEFAIGKLQSEATVTQDYHRQSSIGTISGSLQEREVDTTRVRQSKKNHVYAVSDNQGRPIYGHHMTSSNSGTRSRWYFNRAENASSTHYRDEYIWATHGGIGGAPWDGDHPCGHSEANDIRQSIVTDMVMRIHARAVGVNIKMLKYTDYGF